MTNQHKTLGDKRPRKQFPDIGEALEKAERKGRFKRHQTEQEPETTQQPTQTPANINQSDYIQLPSGLYIARQRTLTSLYWHQTHQELHQQNLTMPTIPQFIEFLTYLRDNPSQENTQIYNDITEKRNPWRAEWLDARFEDVSGKLHANYNHRTQQDGKLQPLNTEQLEDCLMQDCWADIFNPNNQGLPTSKSGNKYKQGENAYFWHPRADRVARFGAGSGGASLNCDRGPQGAGTSLGVRPCAR